MIKCILLAMIYRKSLFIKLELDKLTMILKGFLIYIKNFKNLNSKLNGKLKQIIKLLKLFHSYKNKIYYALVLLIKK